MSVYVSSGAFRTTSIDELFRLAKEFDIQHLELSSGMMYQPNFLDVVRDMKDDFNFLVHNYFPPPEQPFVLNLASSDTQTIQQSLAMCRRNIDLCKALNVPFYSVHSGFVLELQTEDLGKPERQEALAKESKSNYEQAYTIFLRSVRALNQYAKQRAVGLLLENNVRTADGKAVPNVLMSTPDELLRFMADIDDGNVGILLDVGHWNVSAETCGFDAIVGLRQVKSAMRCLHLSDNDGVRDSNQKVSETSWFMGLLSEFNHVPMVVEVYGLSGDDIHQQVNLVEQMKNKL